MWDRYGLDSANAIHQLENPALISFPLAVLTIYIVSLLYPKNNGKLNQQLQSELSENYDVRQDKLKSHSL